MPWSMSESFWRRSRRSISLCVKDSKDGDERPVVLTRRPARVERLVECLLFMHPFHAAQDSTLLPTPRPAIRSWMSDVVMVVKGEHGDVGRGARQADGCR